MATAKAAEAAKGRSGMLLKLKVSKSQPDKASWNKRWFEIEGGDLSYYRHKGLSERLGWIPLDRVQSVESVPPTSVIPGT